MVKKEGTGTLTDDNGNKYVGNWKNDMMNGEVHLQIIQDIGIQGIG